MSSRKFNELVKDKSKEDLLKLYTDLKRECMNLRIAMRSPSEGFKPSSRKECRKNVARVKTRLRQLKDNN
ncbi:MAG: 50S ribosomal protein L29 [Alphaproteobacteria bacterium]|nr:50S ribosomal protein L29 [Alphaproteobacteria bacterium]